MNTVQNEVNNDRDPAFPTIENSDDIERRLDEVTSESVRVRDLKTYLPDIKDGVYSRYESRQRKKHERI